MPCMYMVYTWSNLYAHKHTYKYHYIRVYTLSEHCMNEILAFIIVYTCLYMIHTWHRLGVIDLAVRMIYMSVHVS